MIQINHLKKEYGNIVPIKDVNITINKGEVISLIGPSGTGKSTLIRCINGLETPTSGEIIIGGENIFSKSADIDKIRMKVGMVFQSFNLYKHMTVLKNVMFAPMKLLKKSESEAKEKAMELLEMVGLAEHINHYDSQLSGGQKQRAAIARTLAMEPDVILMDEPTSALDPIMTNEVQAVIMNLKKKGYTMVIVTHSMEFAKKVSSRIIFLSDGVVCEDGTPEQIFENPKEEATRRFVKQLSTLQLKVPAKPFDFYELNGKIEEYCERSGLDRKTVGKTQSVVEELCMGWLRPKLSPDKSIDISLEYSPKDEEMKIYINPNISGVSIMQLETEDNLSYKIVKSRTRSLETDEETGTITAVM